MARNPTLVTSDNLGADNPVAVRLSNGSAFYTASGGGGGSTPNTAGQVDQATITTTAHTFVVPTNAVGFVLISESPNSDNIRWAIGTTATLTVGTLYEPGRDTGFIPCAADISVVALSGSQAVCVQWVLSS